MILHEYLDVNISSKNMQLYKDKGYDIPCKGIYSIKVTDILDGARVKEDRKCDYCGKMVNRSHRAWMDTYKSFNKDLCPSCAKKEQLKNMKETNLEKFGVEFPMQSKEIRDKASDTSVKKYGCKHPLQSQIAKENKVKGIIKKYGVDNPMKVLEVKEKGQQTNLQKYGCTNVFANDEIKKRAKITIQTKYGVDNISQNKDIQKKKEATCEKNYGVKHPTQNKEIMEKVVKNWYKNGTAPTSKPQLKLYDLCQECFPEYSVKINYPLSTLALDVVLENETDKIDIEYDGWFWHQNRRKDRARDEVVKKHGYRIFRIKSATMIPTKEQLHEAVDYLISNDKYFTQIILPDWKDVNKTSKTKTK